jgi:hypothetical protein
LKTGDPAACRQAVEALVAIGIPALPALRRAAVSGDADVRVDATHAIRRIVQEHGERAEAGPTFVGATEAPPDGDGAAEPTSAETAVDAARTAAAPEAPRPGPPPAFAPPRSAGEPSDVLGADALASLMHEFRHTDRFGSDRAELLERILGGRYRFTLVVERTGWTGAFDAAEEFKGGRTVTGRVEGADADAAVRLPPAKNAFADGLEAGQRFDVAVTLVGWDTFYERAVFEGTPA